MPVSPSSSSLSSSERVTTSVAPRSLDAEIVLVLRTSAVIAIVAVFAMTGARSLGEKDGAQALGVGGVLPFQKLVRDASSSDQRMYRAASEGLIEAERIRGTTKAWPQPQVLADQAVPPFAVDPVDAAHHAWTLVSDGAYFEYVGVPAVATVDGVEQKTWLIHLQEPERGVVVVGAPVVDEVHHVLADETPIHASIWCRPGAHPQAAPIVNPIAEGYTQLLVGPLNSL